MKTRKYVLTAIAGMAISGCTNTTDISSVDDLRYHTTARGGTAFTKALTDEYRLQAIYEIDVEDEWDDAAFFARKGLRAARGEFVLPSSPAAAPEFSLSLSRHGALGPVIDIPAGRVADLSAAYFRLVTFLDGGGRAQKPAFSAHAQGLYDCWLEEEWEEDGDFECGPAFLKIEPQLTLDAAPAAVTEPPSEMTRTVEHGPKMDSFQVFFDFDRSTISKDSAVTINQVAERARQRQNGTAAIGITVTGHADAAGPAAYNQALSEHRAKAVRDELIRDGVAGTNIQSRGVGKDGKLVPTNDGIREPQNRRAEIILE